MNKLTPQNLPVLMHRFYDFNDAVVCEVVLRLRGDDPRCRIVIQGQDRDAGPGSWATVTIDVATPSEYRFELGRTTFEVLSAGLQIGWDSGSVCVVLDAYPDSDALLPDLASNTAYVVGSKCLWTSAPIDKRASSP